MVTGESKALDISWDELEPFLRKRRGQGNSSIQNHKSRYKVLQGYFADKEFTPNNFDRFLFEGEKSGKSSSWQNNFIKLVKHLAAYLGRSSEFADYKYLDDHSGHPENVLTPEQIKAIAEVEMNYRYSKNRNNKFPALIYFLANLGSRIGETLKLEWDDIKQDDVPMIHFRKEITKTAKERFVPIPKWLLKMVLELPHDNKFIFSLMDPSNIRKELALRAKMAGISFPVTPHTFRDSSINNKLEFDIPLQEVTALHGHSTTNTTYKYYVKIQAKNLARNLNKHDPAYFEDQTFDIFIQGKKEDIEGSLNNRVCNFIHKEEVVEGKKVVWFGFTEK